LLKLDVACKQACINIASLFHHTKLLLIFSFFLFYVKRVTYPPKPKSLAMVQKPEAKDDENKPKVEEKFPFYKLFNFADKLDVILMIIISQPMALTFGKIINTFGSTDPSHIVKEVSKVFIIIIYLHNFIYTHKYPCSCFFF
jgi:hypothetical protein